jgi:hypothetical protein
VHYEGDVVVADGATYQADCDTAEVPGEGKDWICLARSGRDGATPKVRGLFSATEKYRALNIVALNGGSFIARKDDPGPCPGDGWQLIASQGKAGPKGERGLRGELGQRGERGEPAPLIVRWKLDQSAYAAVPVLSDGSEGPTLELRSLFEQFEMEIR